MINFSVLNSALSDLVGWKQNQIPGFTPISTALQNSTSGYYFNDESWLKPEYIELCYQIFYNTNYPNWVSGQTYQKGQVVTSTVDSNKYIADLETSGTDDPSISADWTIFNPIDNVLIDLQEKGLKRMIEDLTQMKAMNGKTKPLIDNVRFFDGYGNNKDKIIPIGRFVGLELQTTDLSKYLSMRLNRIQTHFTGPVTFDLYLYESGQPNPVDTFTINHTVSGTQWHDLNITLSNYADQPMGGLYYLGYYEDEIQSAGVNAVNYTKFYFDGSNCSSCNPINSHYYRQWSKYASAAPFTINNPDAPANFDPDKVGYILSNNTFGLNAIMYVECDLTQFIIENKNSLVNAWKKATAYQMLRDVSISDRNNRTADNKRNQAFYEVNEGKTLEKEYKDSLKLINFDFSDLDAVCMPCENGNGPKFRTF